MERRSMKIEVLRYASHLLGKDAKKALASLRKTNAVFPEEKRNKLKSIELENRVH